MINMLGKGPFLHMIFTPHMQHERGKVIGVGVRKFVDKKN